MDELDIHKHYTLDFPPEAVFDAWISPDTVVAPVTSITVEPEVGGAFCLFIDNDTQSQMNGQFIEFVRPTKLVYTWEWNGDGEVSQVQVKFVAVPTGTDVILAHTGFKKASSSQAHHNGWDSYIKGVQQVLEVMG